MATVGPGGTKDAEWEKYRRYFLHDPLPATKGPVQEIQYPWDLRVRFWIVGPDGSARRGEYAPESGVREIPH